MVKHSNQLGNKLGNKQAGGTILGIIIGLIVGLAIAVVVAVTITKTSLPFSNKSNRQEKASELTPDQQADPNKPLYGNKEPAKEAAKEFAKTSESLQTADDAAKKPEAVGDKAGAKPADKDLKGADAKNAPAKPDGTEEKWIYFLQAGAFREQADAENTRAKLALLGFEASISEKPSDNGTLYRVRIGPFGQLETMNRIRAKLSDNGVDAAVVRSAK